jgi:hypothetical protein
MSLSWECRVEEKVEGARRGGGVCVCVFVCVFV